MAWARVQTFSQNAQFAAGLVASSAVTLASAVAIGDVVLIITTMGVDPTVTATTVTDNLGNTWSRLSVAQGGQLWNPTNVQGTDAWWCIITVAGTPTITFAPAGTNAWLGIKGSHFTGSDAASIRRDSKGALQSNPGVGANVIATASVAASSGDLVWGGSGRPGTGSASTEVAGTGYTGSVIDATTSMIDEWKTAAGAGAVTFTDATNGGVSDYMTFGIAISPASAAVSKVLLAENSVRLRTESGLYLLT